MEQASNQIIQCANCGAKNRIPPDKADVEARCGKCGSSLKGQKQGERQTDAYLFRCTDCGARNRIPPDKINAGAKCGKCGVALKTDELFAPQPIMVTDTNFDSKVMKSPLPVLLFAWAPWCPTCRSFIPVIDDFAKDAKGKVRVGKLNVDGNPTLSSKYSILSVPYVYIFDNGQLKESLPGAMQKHDIMMKMAPYL
jgi:thioredoxin 2